MDRVERAIQEGRCVLVFGGRTLQDAEVLGELRRRPSIPAVVLSGEARSPATGVIADTVSPALSKEGGLICLIEADSTDSVGLNALAALVKASPHKPRLVVVARAFNPFTLPTDLRTLKFEHEKKKAKEFLFPLPVPVVAAPAPVATVVASEEPKKKAAGGAPRSSFVGRVEELARLGEILEVGGPVVMYGPAGVGRRWLVEKALSGSSLRRVPDFSVGWGSETDSLYARLAALCSAAGDTRLADALRSPTARPAPAQLAALAVECLGNSALENTVMVIDHLEHSLRGDGTFHREGRLEMLLKALLLARFKMRIIFLSTLRTRFYREGEGVHLPILELGGLKGGELHEVFDAWRVEDFPRAHFGDIINRIFGHPFAARMFAIAVRDPQHRDELMDNRRFFQMENISHLEPIARRIAKAMENLPEDERKALATLAHFRLPFSSADMDKVGVDRRLRLALQAKGLLDQTPDDVKERLFQVHSLVAAHLDPRERADFATLELLGNWYVEKGAKSEGLQQLAWNQEGNRYLFEAHRIRNRARMPFPDNDPALESLRGMIRSKKPRYDMAEQRIGEVLSMDPANTEIQLMKTELMIALRVSNDDISKVFREVQERTPTPEAFHAEATWWQMRNSGRGKAASALERGLLVFGESGRMRRRLAGIYVDQGRVDDAIAQLAEAMTFEPMMPDTYGILGELYLQKGLYEKAEQCLEEARRLDPENGLHMARMGALLIERAIPERQAEAEELLKGAVEKDKRSYLAHLYYARVILARPEPDLEQADWLLKNAARLDESSALPLVERARISARKQAWGEATVLLDKSSRLDPGCHEAYFVRGEMYEAQGHIFNADQEYHRALERSPKDSKARVLYEAAIARVQELISSGQALELQKAAEAAGIPAPTEPQPRSGSRGTVRRKKGGRDQNAPASAGEENPAAEAVSSEESALEEAAAKEAAAEGTVDEPTEETMEADAPPDAAV